MERIRMFAISGFGLILWLAYLGWESWTQQYTGPRNDAERNRKEEADEWLRKNEPGLYYGNEHDHWDYHG